MTEGKVPKLRSAREMRMVPSEMVSDEVMRREAGMSREMRVRREMSRATDVRCKMRSRDVSPAEVSWTAEMSWTAAEMRPPAWTATMGTAAWTSTMRSAPVRSSATWTAVRRGYRYWRTAEGKRCKHCQDCLAHGFLRASASLINASHRKWLQT